ncbi:MAG TPA: hypothetical protein VM661_09935 [Candidatus Sulfotelmatobacter sp.]|jgi:hypothetical protein|nr:hypothetical protein [Candidatus Sulfotelmatobacter sp.]
MDLQGEIRDLMSESRVRAYVPVSVVKRILGVVMAAGLLAAVSVSVMASDDFCDRNCNLGDSGGLPSAILSPDP